MAIEKMKLLGITGNSNNLDRFIANVLFKSEVQIVDAKKIYDKGWKLEYFNYDYRIKETLKKCEKLLTKLEVPYSKESNMAIIENDISDIFNEINNLDSSYEECISSIKNNNKLNQNALLEIDDISRIKEINIEMQKLYNLKYIKFRYGSIPKKNLEEIKKQEAKLNVIIFEIMHTGDLVWIMYFTPLQFVSSIDGIFNIQKFERKMFPVELIETPQKYIMDLKDKIRQRDFFNAEAEQRIEKIRKKVSTIILGYYRELQTYDKINSIKKYIIHDQNNTFYIVAWIPENSLSKMKNELEMQDDLDYVVKDGENPPTKLKNNRIIRPFEELVKMYGMPKKDELDPTWFVAITTFIMFGFMFGDVGHGAIFAILGILLLIKKQKTYGSILLAGGISATMFGFLYGSIFGKEEIIKSILISPMNDINTMLVYGITVGAIFVLIAMVLNIVNGIKNKDFKRIFLDANGVAGILLYLFILICVAYYFLVGKMLISINIIVITSFILILVIMFNDKITNIIKRKKEEASVPFVEKVFEIIEMILSFLSNTISFLRLAAFAINHAGLCMAVYLLADMTSGAGNILIAVLGNIVVLVLEGLIVGIQTLRLEYYELFSRFYDGSGKEYKSLKTQLEEQN